MADAPDAPLVLLRFSGDISIKSRATRHQFVRRLLHNLHDALDAEGHPSRVRLSHDLLTGARLESVTECPQQDTERGRGEDHSVEVVLARRLIANGNEGGYFSALEPEREAGVLEDVVGLFDRGARGE